MQVDLMSVINIVLLETLDEIHRIWSVEIKWPALNDFVRDCWKDPIELNPVIVFELMKFNLSFKINFTIAEHHEIWCEHELNKHKLKWINIILWTKS